MVVELLFATFPFSEMDSKYLKDMDWLGLTLALIYSYLIPERNCPLCRILRSFASLSSEILLVNEKFKDVFPRLSSRRVFIPEIHLKMVIKSRRQSYRNSVSILFSIAADDIVSIRFEIAFCVDD